MKQPVPTADGRTTVLVSGAGFAGLATAFWMLRSGFRVEVVEAAPGLRRGGTPVDVEGDAIGILERMGLIEAVRAKALPPRGFQFKDARDATLGEVAASAAPAGAERLEIHRDDLLDILFAAVERAATVRFGRSIVRLDQGRHDIAVTFDDETRGRYALVLGCDGNRSSTRRLAFAGDPDPSHFMGGYFVLKVVADTSFLPADMSQVYSEPGTTALLNGYADRTDLGLAFRSAVEIACGHRDRAEQHRLIHRHCDALGWKVPRMLAHLDADDTFYFDRISQIRMPAWSVGRVVLVGDAGYGVSPVAGWGGSIAIIGAARLADALVRHGDDHEAAFRAYDQSLRPFVDAIQQRAATTGMATMFPADADELAERDRRLGAGTIDF